MTRSFAGCEVTGARLLVLRHEPTPRRRRYAAAPPIESIVRRRHISPRSGVPLSRRDRSALPLRSVVRYLRRPEGVAATLYANLATGV